MIYIVLAVFMVLINTPVFAECTRIEFAELQTMTKNDLEAEEAKCSREEKYYFKMSQYERMGSRRYEELSDKKEKCAEEEMRIMKFINNKFNASVKTEPTASVMPVNQPEPK